MTRADGKGTDTPWATYYQDQIASPMVQLAADAASSIQATRSRPEDRAAAHARLIAAIPDATPSPMSSTAIVGLSPPIRNLVQIRNATEVTKASEAAIANRFHSLARAPCHIDLTEVDADAGPPGVGKVFRRGVWRSAGEVCQATIGTRMLIQARLWLTLRGSIAAQPGRGARNSRHVKELPSSRSRLRTATSSCPEGQYHPNLAPQPA